VTINPNPDGCYRINKDAVGTHENLLESGINIVSHHTTDEEHDAAKASLLALEREQADPQGLDVRSDVDTMADVFADTEINTTSKVNADQGIEQRDPNLSCFDGGTDGICYYCIRDTA
jgi:hypothetical protein